MRRIRLLLAVVWAIFTAWLVVYGMPISGLFAIGGVWALWPSRAARTWRRTLAAVLLPLAGLLAVPVVGLPEYAATTNALHCRALGFTDAVAPRDCDPAEVARGRAAAAANEDVFSWRERMGVHGFNLLLAAGGYVLGLDEVAWETAAMSWRADPLPPGASVSQRRAQCRASWSEAAHADASLGPVEVVASDFPMRSGRVRERVAAGMRRLSSAPGATLDLGEIHFASQGDDVTAYTGALVHDSLRVALALEVGDSRLALTRRAHDVEVTWTGTIHYPPTDLAFSAPIPWTGQVLRVSEPVFCAMHADGAMAPYPLVYTWTIDADDPRLRDLGPERGVLETVGVALIQI